MKKLMLIMPVLAGILAFHLLTIYQQAAFAQADGASCPNLMPTRLILHERGRVSVNDPNPLNVRQNAGTNHVRIGSIPVGGVFYVLEGFECTTQYTWYRVEYRGASGALTGWIAEGDKDYYFVEPYPPGQ